MSRLIINNKLESVIKQFPTAKMASEMNTIATAELYQTFKGELKLFFQNYYKIPEVGGRL